MVYALASEVLKKNNYAEIAITAAESAVCTATELGTLCCGLAGVGYACLAAHRLTGEPQWLARARDAARRAATCTADSYYRDSLYKGAVGVALLTQELRDPNSAAMPVFERLAC
jgi:serine/threonine-protein kinase